MYCFLLAGSINLCKYGHQKLVKHWILKQKYKKHNSFRKIATYPFTNIHLINVRDHHFMTFSPHNCFYFFEIMTFLLQWQILVSSITKAISYLQWNLLGRHEWVFPSLEAMVTKKEEKGVIQRSWSGQLTKHFLCGFIIMYRHLQVVVGVLGEMEIGKSGTFLMQKEITKDSKLVRACRKFLLAGVLYWSYWIIPQVLPPQPLLKD